MTDIKDFDPRKCMELAIHQMKQSVNEPRDDGKASPSVGVVLIKRDGKFDFAHRGELRHGDHAEYTLLERKNRQTALDGSILFSTLEPCAPGARSERKLGCAERIVLARIKEVWIGLADPDPKVDRKGIEYLKENGIKVHMFDRDLQEEIREANKDFFRQALERAAEEEKPEKIKLSEYEEILPSTDLKDFSGDALNSYREKINLTDAIGSAGFNRRLIQQGLLKEEKGELIPTGFGIVLFGKEPRITMPQTGLLATVLYPNGREEIENFEDPIVLIPEMLEAWLRKTLALTINRDSMERKEEIDMPFDIIRESVVNALIHRDYDIKGAKCQLYITEDTITVKSPGQPLHPITIEKLQSFEAPMLSRNPTLHYIFAQMDLAEERGLGMETLKSIPEKYDLPLPKYTYEAPYLNLTLYRNKAALERIDAKLQASLKADEREGLLWLSQKIEITREEYAIQMKIDKRAAQRQLKRFVELGLLERIGSGPSTKYKVVRK